MVFSNEKKAGKRKERSDTEKKELIREESKAEYNVKGSSAGLKKPPKDNTSSTKNFPYVTPSSNDGFLSNHAQKRKAEVRKMALEKRKQYGKLIQKQVLKMHKKKTQPEDQASSTNRYSQGSGEVTKDEKSSSNKIDQLIRGTRQNKRSASVFNHPLRLQKSKEDDPKEETIQTAAIDKLPPKSAFAVNSKNRSRQNAVKSVMKSHKENTDNQDEVYSYVFILI